MNTLRVDAHQHFWHYDAKEYAWIDKKLEILQRNFLPSDSFPLLLEGRMNACVAVQARASLAENTFLLDLAGRYSWIRAVVGWLNLRDKHIESQLAGVLEHSQAQRLKGFRHLVQDESSPSAVLEEEAFNAGLKYVQSQGYVYEVLVRAADLPAAARFCARHDRAPLVIDHFGKPELAHESLGAWRTKMQALAALPHVYCKLSGLITEAVWHHWKPAELIPYFHSALELFGAERLIFGSDWPVCLLSGSYADVVTLAEAGCTALSPAEKEAVWGATACKVYGIRI